jgi:hypothetical protein
MTIVIIENENNASEWVKMEKNGYLYTVYHYINNNLERKLNHDDFYAAVETLKEWESYFE